MIFNNTPSDKLSGEQLSKVAFVLININTSSDDQLSGNKITEVFCSKKINSRLRNINITLDISRQLEKEHIEILHYLVNQGAIKSVTIPQHNEEYDFKITLIPDEFNEFYKKMIPLAVPYIESSLRTLKIDDTKNQNIELAKVDEKTTPTVTAEVKFIDKKVTIWIDGMGSILIKRISRDGAPANFLRYLESHQNEMLGLYKIQTDVKKCSKKNNLTELARQCGFNAKLKELFFTRCEAKRIVYSQTTDMPRDYAEFLINNYRKS